MKGKEREESMVRPRFWLHELKSWEVLYWQREALGEAVEMDWVRENLEFNFGNKFKVWCICDTSQWFISHMTEGLWQWISQCIKWHNVSDAQANFHEAVPSCIHLPEKCLGNLKDNSTARPTTPICNPPACWMFYNVHSSILGIWYLPNEICFQMSYLQ